MFKFIVIIYMFLDLCHSLWIEDQIKKVKIEEEINKKCEEKGWLDE